MRKHCDILLVSLALGAMVAIAGGGETELSWDDGSGGYSEDVIHGAYDRMAAVLFIAPPEAVAVTRFRAYIEHDACTVPGFPPPRDFAIGVWKPNLGTPPMPYESAGGAAHSGEDYLEEAWADLVLPEPIRIDSEEHFPSGWFFAVLEWYTCEPALGVDTNSASSGMSRFRAGAGTMTWDAYPANLMIRAVVVDSLDTPVEIQSWGAVKVEYR